VLPLYLSVRNAYRIRKRAWALSHPGQLADVSSGASRRPGVVDDKPFDFPWAVGLTATQWQRVASSLLKKTVKRGAYVCRIGETASYWYGVTDGLVKMSGGTVGGRPLSLIGIATGGWFGEGTLIKAERRKYDIVALRDSQLILVPADLFLWLVENSPPFAKWIMFQLNERLGQFIALLANNRLASNNERIARTLAWMFNPYLYPGMPYDIPVSQEEIGELAGASRQRTNAALHRLAELNLLKIGYGHVTVVDIEGLRDFRDDVIDPH
jgi:CRP/FNR family cyclic AMP-dependent transcriptional regulator